MKHPRTAMAVLTLMVAVGLAAGCETLGRRQPREVVAGEVPGEGSKSTAKAKWQPGAWSSEARDVEKSVMRTTADPTWQP